ncbi:hypothetical protein B0H13DRAFT_1881959 [Mycena leptocephala]|nr:hypothetical protein B0H13DRAFT_1881959 [Mycena leptocephala]
MMERRRSKRLNSNPRAERYETRSLRNMITELRSNKLATTISSHLTHYGSEDGALIPWTFHFKLRARSSGPFPPAEICCSLGQFRFNDQQQDVSGAEFTETAIKKEYQLAVGRVCSEPERDAASVEIEWKDNEKGCPSCGDWIKGKTLLIGELLRKNKKELESHNVMEILIKASVIGVTVAH